MIPDFRDEAICEAANWLADYGTHPNEDDSPSRRGIRFQDYLEGLRRAASAARARGHDQIGMQARAGHDAAGAPRWATVTVSADPPRVFGRLTGDDRPALVWAPQNTPR